MSKHEAAQQLIDFIEEKLRDWVPPEYWKPEPRTPFRDPMMWALFSPAFVWIIGAAIYGGEAIRARDIQAATDGLGSWMMVIGGEVGTIFVVIEVFRKLLNEDHGWIERLFDIGGLAISMIATLGVVAVPFARQTSIVHEWVNLVRTYGPLVLLVCSVFDFYANGMEAGFYLMTFAQRWEKWNQDKRTFQERERNKYIALLTQPVNYVAATPDAPPAADEAPVTQDDAPPAADEAPVQLNKPMFDKWLASLNGRRDTLTRDEVLQWAIGLGADVSSATGRATRDKVMRWCRRAEIN